MRLACAARTEGGEMHIAFIAMSGVRAASDELNRIYFSHVESR